MSSFLDELVTRVAEQTPDAPAVRYMGEVITYAALDRRANAIAAQLVELGVAEGDRVGLFQPKSIDTVATILGILRAGAAYVPIDPAAPAERVRFAMTHAGVKVLFTSGRPKKLCDKAEPALPFRMVSAVEGDSNVAPVRNRSKDDLAYILYTSGSTGAPKGVAITHHQSLAFVLNANEVFQIGGADRIASHAPFNFDLSVIDLFCAFHGGAEVTIIPDKWISFPAKIKELIDGGLTVWNSVPSALTQLIDRGGLDGASASLRLVMFAGEPIPEKTLEALRSSLPNTTLMNVYGQTEANSSTYHVVDEVVTPLPIGRTFPGYEVLLVGDDGAIGDEGEIYVVSEAVASGYFGDAARSKTAFVSHPLNERRRAYRTGDRARRTADGQLLFGGRKDNAIKVRGYRVELGEIEGVAMKAGVRDASAVSVPDPDAGHVIHLFVVGDDAPVRAMLAKHLPKYMLPESIVAVDVLPRTANGKVDRPALVQLLG